MADNFQAGDVVQLKSGGPVMTVDSVGVEHQGGTVQGAYCSWFESASKGKQARKKEWFPFTSLKAVNPDADSGFYPGSSIMG